MRAPFTRSRTQVFARRLPVVSRIVPQNAPPLQRMTSMSSSKTAIKSSFPAFRQASKNQSLQHTTRSFSTQFREDYDSLYSHGLTGIQTQSDPRGLCFGDNSDVITFGAQPQHQNVSSQMETVEDDYDVEAAFLDYSENEFESWFPSTTTSNAKNGTIVNAEKMSIYDLDFEGNP